MQVSFEAAGPGSRDACLELVSDARRFFSKAVHERGRLEVGEAPDGSLLIVFRARRFGLERQFPVKARRKRGEGRIVYESTPDSPRRMRLVIECEETGEGVKVRGILDLQTDPTVGPVAGWIFREMLEAALREAASAKAGSPVRVTCDTCMLYDPTSRRCTVLNLVVADPSRPPCEGRYYLRRPARILE